MVNISVFHVKKRENHIILNSVTTTPKEKRTHIVKDLEKLELLCTIVAII